ncbi:hypothetical protein E1264_20075 [Actinomadura sp. KC216]|uniref:hypothetical protein n=1 Tax=Actinomadura sp. KC216 TaxID=2530370 RepID=UPI00105322CD|nr:hypothetical protein [Actinomadura sp. KC216]TDB85775.1 hypothetical protein E1264_20075 [Actinomadura sp. KC216]
MAATAIILIGGSSAALADGAHFVPEATDVSWDGTVATITFREVDVVLKSDVTTISVKVTADVDATCRRGVSILHIHRSATALDTKDYPISDDGTVEGVASAPLKVTGLNVSGFTCVITHVSITAVLEDFCTGATLIDTTDHRQIRKAPLASRVRNSLKM